MDVKKLNILNINLITKRKIGVVLADLSIFKKFSCSSPSLLNPSHPFQDPTDPVRLAGRPVCCNWSPKMAHL